jgi:MFS superfamily sulfate permease-like transporter
MAVPGLMLFRFGAELFFANANAFQDRVKELVEKENGKVKWFVLDAENMTDIDVTGREALEQTIEYLKKKGFVFGISRAHHPIPELLEHYELMKEIGKEHMYATNRDAVEAFERATGGG